MQARLIVIPRKEIAKIKPVVLKVSSLITLLVIVQTVVNRLLIMDYYPLQLHFKAIADSIVVACILRL